MLYRQDMNPYFIESVSQIIENIISKPNNLSHYYSDKNLKSFIKHMTLYRRYVKLFRRKMTSLTIDKD